MSAKPGMVEVIRDLAPTRGGAFFKDDQGEVMFQYVIDSGNIIGPRKAHKADSEKHPEAWQAFMASGALAAKESVPSLQKPAKPKST